MLMIEKKKITLFLEESISKLSLLENHPILSVEKYRNDSAMIKEFEVFLNFFHKMKEIDKIVNEESTIGEFTYLWKEGNFLELEIIVVNDTGWAQFKEKCLLLSILARKGHHFVESLNFFNKKLDRILAKALKQNLQVK